MAGKPIVVGVDHSPESLRAAEVAAQLARAAGAPLVPVHAVPVVPLFTGVVGAEPMGPAFSPELQDELVDAARGQVARALQAVLPAASVGQLVVESGAAPFVIAELARRRGAQLVVLGGKHHGALARGLGRSTAHYLVRTLDVPLVVVAQTTARVARILAAVDLSAVSLPTLTLAERFAKLLGARLRVVHVIEPLGVTEPVGPLDVARYEQRSREGFDQLLGRFPAIGAEDRVVRTGPAAETIAEEAATWHAELLVVGSHGKGWVDRILVGSATERLVTELPTSILVVPYRPLRRVTAGPRMARHPRGRRPRRPPKPRRRRR